MKGDYVNMFKVDSLGCDRLETFRIFNLKNLIPLYTRKFYLTPDSAQYSAPCSAQHSNTIN